MVFSTSIARAKSVVDEAALRGSTPATFAKLLLHPKSWPFEWAFVEICLQVRAWGSGNIPASSILPRVLTDLVELLHNPLAQITFLIGAVLLFLHGIKDIKSAKLKRLREDEQELHGRMRLLENIESRSILASDLARFDQFIEVCQAQIAEYKERLAPWLGDVEFEYGIMNALPSEWRRQIPNIADFSSFSVTMKSLPFKEANPHFRNEGRNRIFIPLESREFQKAEEKNLEMMDERIAEYCDLRRKKQDELNNYSSEIKRWVRGKAGARY